MFSYLKPHTSFTSVQEMDEHVDKHLNYHELTKSEKAILRNISQHALATPGAAHLKAQTIADKLSLSTKTVYRAVKNMQEQGILKKLPQTKMNGIKGANIYVICPYVPSILSERTEDETPTVASVEDPKPTDQSFSFQLDLSSKNIYKASAINVLHEKLYNIYSSWPLMDSLKEQLKDAIAGLPLENEQDLSRAKWVLQELLVRVQTKGLTIQSSFAALLKGAYKKWILPPVITEVPVQQSTRPVPFYDWLKEREGV